MKLPVLDKKGKETDQIDLSDDIFGKRIKSDIIHQAMLMYRANQRQGTASTKERADVRGGGRKPYRQKGTGRARQGSIRAPQFIGGGVVFGPRPRDFGYSLPKKMRRAALRESLNAKVQGGQVVFIEELKDEFKKTREVAGILKTLNLNGKTLALLEGCDESIKLAGRNIPRFEIIRAEDVTAYDLIRNKYVLLTQTAFKTVMDRINSK
ncbi:MAG: 50S ribosomal protein L4 [Candidatus Omnitrophota bacterium]